MSLKNTISILIHNNALAIFIGITVLLSSCTIPRKFQKDKAFLFKNNIEVKGQNLSNKEKNNLKGKLMTQLDDSAKTNVKDFAFFLHFINKPPAYDTSYTSISANNMKAALIHSGYYSPKVTYTSDTAKDGNQKRVTVNYHVEPGNPTRIDTVAYNFFDTDLQTLVKKNEKQSFLVENNLITKADILSEKSRLIELFRNNGYYKFSQDNITIIGDTTIDLLTNITDDPFENLRLLAEAKEKRNTPTIKLTVALNKNMDSATFRKYYINNIYVYPDYPISDDGNIKFTEEKFRNTQIFYQKKIFKPSFLLKNIYFRKQQLFRQNNFSRTVNGFSKTGVWQSINVQLLENKDSINKLDVVIQLTPGKKYGFEANIESSYSSNNNYALGNLVGFSGNISIQNKNVAKEAIRMTHAIRAGIEFNVSKNKSTNGIINSNDLGYTNTILIPKLVVPVKSIKRRSILSQQTFINTNVTYNNRFNLFKLQSYNIAFGYDWSNRNNKAFILKPLNFEFSYLYNRSDSFISTLEKNPYLRYSFNTALVMGASFSYTTIHLNQKTKWQRDFKLNVEESGLLWGRFGILKQYLRQFIKTDAELTWTKTYKKSSHVFRFFGGVGIPVGKKDSSLPFFKQYFAGGSNSMRGWPVRSIGQGARPLPGYGTTTFNDRTGDVKLETNYEYRYIIATIIPNTLVLKGAFFIDAGNIWNFKNTLPPGVPDSLQFSFKNLYKQLGVTGGTGFRLDFNYFLIRFDLGFRFKRPDISKDNGWQMPNISFNNLFKRGVEVPDLNTPDPNDKINDERYKRWRYENFNFTIGISYPF
jgi:outer membrane protein insertion porin family